MRWPPAALLLSALFLPVGPLSGQDAEIRVDPRVELLAVVNRLAGRAEYKLTRVPLWAAAVDSHFAVVGDHPAVAMTRRLGFGFFIPMNLAVHLTMVPDLAERTPFSTSTTLHRRWKTLPDSTRAYVELLRAFAKDSRFTDFLAANRPLIDSAQTRLRRVASSIDHAWIDRFWGGGRFHGRTSSKQVVRKTFPVQRPCLIAARFNLGESCAFVT